jgi:hypothetical protein
MRTEEDEEFERIERESGWRKRQIKEREPRWREWYGLTAEDMKDERTHNFDFIHGARWAEKILKERNCG